VPEVQELAFAGAREILGSERICVDVADGATADELLAVICALYPALEPYRGSIRVAVNGSYAQGDERITPGDEVALIPPVAGG
jgi:molybdopterin synthase catalytic subunit/molybdopterin synthase sulfur carrier subunit